jgi:hypothetical protein
LDCIQARQTQFDLANSIVTNLFLEGEGRVGGVCMLNLFGSAKKRLTA